jgi:hypothetical protein
MVLVEMVMNFIVEIPVPAAVVFTEMQFWIYNNCPSYVDVDFTLPRSAVTPRTLRWAFGNAADAELFELWSVLRWS